MYGGYASATVTSMSAAGICAVHTIDRGSTPSNRLIQVRSGVSLAIPTAHLVEGRWGIREGRELFRRIVATRPWPTAVVCGNAYLAVGALLESQALGIAVPGTMSIVGYDDIEIMSHLPVPLTTVRVPGQTIGRSAAQVLLARMEGRAIDIPLESEAEIVVRASSGPPPAHISGLPKEPS